MIQADAPNDGVANDSAGMSACTVMDVRLTRSCSSEVMQMRRPGEVRVRVDATTLNFNDIDGIYGRYRTVSPRLPYTPGMEVLGHVDACGDGTEFWLGRRVVATPTGAYRRLRGVGRQRHAAMTFAMPDDLDVARPRRRSTFRSISPGSLFERGRLQSGETVLVHAAAEGIGSAAVQLAEQYVLVT